MAGNSDIDSLLSLIKVAEELLFSFPLPQEVVSKYEFIRAKTFTKCHLPNNNSHISRLQIEAHCKLERESSKVVNTSTIDMKELDLQSKQQNSVLMQKSFNLLERCNKLILHAVTYCDNLLSTDSISQTHYKNSSKFIDIPTKSFDLLDRELESEFESFKSKIMRNEHELLTLLTKLEEKITSNSVYIQKLELDSRDNSSYLSKNNSELLEKNKILQEKINKERLENEKKIKELREEILLSKNNSLMDVRKAQIREIEKIMQERDMFQDESERLKEQLDSVSFALQKELRNVHEDYDKNSQEMMQNFAYKLKESENKHVQKIESLEKKLYYKEKELKDKVEKIEFESQAEISKLNKELNFFKNNSESLQNLIENIRVIADRIYKRFSDEPVEAKDLNQSISKQVEFLDRVVDKLSKDNNWLVDRISELNKENEDLKKRLQEMRVQDAMIDLENSTTALKSFEQSRDKLKKKFSESSIPFPDTYSKLVHKYSNLS